MGMSGTIGDPNWIPTSILYNHTTVWLTEKDDSPSTALEKEEVVVLNGKYKTKSGHLCVLTKEVNPGSQEYFLGYRFVGSNDLYYKEDGSTYDPEHLDQGDALIEKLI